MKDTMDNQSRAFRILSDILEVSEDTAAKNKDNSLIEFNLLKDFSQKNPQLDMHSSLGLSIDGTNKKQMESYLKDVVATPVGYVALESTLTASKLRDATNKHLANLQKGGLVSDIELDGMRSALKETQDSNKLSTERLNNYKAGIYEKGMVNTEDMQANADSGKQVFKTTEHKILSYGIDANGKPEVYSVNRKMGNNKDYASITYPNNDMSFTVIHGQDITKAQAILVLADDNENKLYQAGKPNGVKAPNTADHIQGVALADLMGIKQKDPDGLITSVVSTDIRNFKPLTDMLERINPTASLAVGVKANTDKLSFIGNNGEKQAIPSAFEQVADMIKNNRFEASPRKDGIQLFVMRSDESMVAVHSKLSQAVQEAHPDDPAAMYARKDAVSTYIVDQVKADGKVLTDMLNDAYKGVDVAGKYEDYTVVEKAAMDSRRDKSINILETEPTKKKSFESETLTVKTERLPNPQPSLLEDGKDKPKPKALNSPQPPRM